MRSLGTYRNTRGWYSGNKPLSHTAPSTFCVISYADRLNRLSLLDNEAGFTSGVETASRWHPLGLTPVGPRGQKPVHGLRERGDAAGGDVLVLPDVGGVIGAVEDRVVQCPSRAPGQAVNDERWLCLVQHGVAADI